MNDVTGDNVDLVAFLLPQKDDKSIDIGIMPVSSNQKGLVPYESSKTLPDGFKQMKVEELRKLIVSKLGMTATRLRNLRSHSLFRNSVSRTNDDFLGISYSDFNSQNRLQNELGNVLLWMQ